MASERDICVRLPPTRHYLVGGFGGGVVSGICHLRFGNYALEMLVSVDAALEKYMYVRLPPTYHCLGLGSNNPYIGSLEARV